MKSVIILSFSLFIYSCAGPTNPFGGDVFISDNFSFDKLYTGDDIQLNFSPGRQYYNSPYSLKINLIDPNFNITNFRYEIIYNNRKINRWYKSEQIKFPQDRLKPIEIRFNNLSILPGHTNKIKFVYYPVNSDSPIIHEIKVPECFKEFDSRETLHIAPFKVSSSLKNDIELMATKHGYNTSLVAALIAQESSFNPKAMSTAKALGLTQVTPLAHQEIKKFKKDWNIFPDFSNMSYKQIRSELSKNSINPNNDWRLDQKKSIEGGILYMKYLVSYWNAPKKRKLLSHTFKNDIPTVEILLASYNSGAYRVKKSITNGQQDWLFDQSLKEARKYVMNIKSYCYAFTKGREHDK